MSTQKASKPSKISAKPETLVSKKDSAELSKEDLDKGDRRDLQPQSEQVERKLGQHPSA